MNLGITVCQACRFCSRQWEFLPQDVYGEHPLQGV